MMVHGMVHTEYPVNDRLASYLQSKLNFRFFFEREGGVNEILVALECSVEQI